MKRISILIVILLGVLAYWFVENDQRASRNLQSAIRDGSHAAVHGTATLAREKAFQVAFGIENRTERTALALRERVEKVHQVALDASITAAVKMKLANDGVVSASQIAVDTHNGVVILRGGVESAVEANIAVELARSVEGVRSVDSRLNISKSA